MARTIIPTVVDGDDFTDDFTLATKDAVDELSAATPESYTAWTPTFTGITIGNGTVTGRHYKAGRIGICEFELVFGSTTAINGSGADINLPYALLQATWFATVHLFDNGTGTFVGSSNGATVRRLVVSGTALAVAIITPTQPFTWTTGDRISYRATYLTNAA